MKFFFSCDWGTSTFRLKLVQAENAKVLSVIKTDYGIAAAYDDWKQMRGNEKNRLTFYQNYLLEQVKKIAADFNDSLYGGPILLSGMASSSIGMMELPYKTLPFQSNGSDLVIHTIPVREENGSYKIIMISGVRSETDVMRGEETILAGCDISDDEKQQLFIFPGTHSKHITVKNGIVENIATYMTGELFDLLSNKSILSASVKKNATEQNTDSRHFAEGVLKGSTSNLMNSIFQVRTNQLLGKATLAENYNYLSGLLIGYELKEIVKKGPAAITLVCSEGLKEAYMDALQILCLNKSLHYKNADDALINGQWKILQQHG